MKLYDKVKLKRNSITGIIVDITSIDGKEIFTVEDDVKAYNTTCHRTGVIFDISRRSK